MSDQVDPERKPVETAPEQAHNEVERQVQERTAELVRVNEALRAELARVRIEEQFKAECKLWESQFLQAQKMEKTAELTRIIDALRAELAERIRTEEQLKVECKLWESQFLQAQKMESIGQLAGGMAHDFNNLLMVILGYAELILPCLDSSSSMGKGLEGIREAGNRAAALTRQLLAFSRKQSPQPQVLNLNTTIIEMDKMLRRLIDEHIALITIPGQALGRVKADLGQIEQVIMNLVINARDAMPQGGALTIETANVELDETCACWQSDVQAGPYMMLAVSDTGCGMDEATQARIFEPFFTTKEVGKGTGLGLSTVYSIVKQSGGYIRVSSEVGRGTTFKIYLPCAGDAVEPRSSQKASGVMPRGTETVLVVEDNLMVRTLAVRVLQGQGYTVLEASNGGEALLAAQERKGAAIHLLLTDLVMPQMNGREAAEYLACLYPNIRVIYMSGYTDSPIIQHDILDAGTSLLQKPFTPEAMARKVREVLDTPLDRKEPIGDERSRLRWPAEPYKS